MRKYANIQVSPRSIAWLVDINDWKHLEQVVEHNSALLGGIYNLLVPINGSNIDPIWLSLLREFDPDLIILAPGIDQINLDSSISLGNQFAIIPWKSRFLIISKDASSSGTGLNVPSSIIPSKTETELQAPLIAVSDIENVDSSRFALLACGDLKPRRPIMHTMDGELSTEDHGARECFLRSFVCSDTEQHIGAVFTADGRFLEAPDRIILKTIIRKENQFPLVGAIARMDAALGLCMTGNQSRRSFINITACGLNRNFEFHGAKQKQIPNLVLLISEVFDIDQAILFWNLRAMNAHIAWISFSEVEAEFDELVRWLESDYGGKFYAFGGQMGHGCPPFSIAFSTSPENMTRLEGIFSRFQSRRIHEYPKWGIMSNKDLIVAENERPVLRRERVQIAEEDVGICSFLLDSSLPSGFGMLVARVDWPGAVLPQSARPLISRTQVPIFVPALRWPGGEPVSLPKLRVDRTNRIRCQIESSSDEPIVFPRPRFLDIVNQMLIAAGCSGLIEGAASKYQRAFCDRAGGLASAAEYLRDDKYGALFKALAAKPKTKHPYTWSARCPEWRHVVHHYHLLQMLKWPEPDRDISSETVGFYYKKIVDQLPPIVINLLKKHLLERGYQLKCENCAYNGWYPAELAGQDFRCQQCGEQQLITSNPLWLYKLPEVIYQGMDQDMDVPLLALDALRERTRYAFEHHLDAGIRWSKESQKLEGNIDFLCSLDGHIYIGEAKKNDEIEEQQVDFYKDLAKRAKFDGLVFATASRQWKAGTKQQLERLAASWPGGDVILLSHNDLYRSGPSPTSG